MHAHWRTVDSAQIAASAKGRIGAIARRLSAGRTRLRRVAHVHKTQQRRCFSQQGRTHLHEVKTAQRQCYPGGGFGTGAQKNRHHGRAVRALVVPCHGRVELRGQSQPIFRAVCAHTDVAPVGQRGGGSLQGRLPGIALSQNACRPAAHGKPRPRKFTALNVRKRRNVGIGHCGMIRNTAKERRSWLRRICWLPERLDTWRIFRLVFCRAGRQAGRRAGRRGIPLALWQGFPLAFRLPCSLAFWLVSPLASRLAFRLAARRRR